MRPLSLAAFAALILIALGAAPTSSEGDVGPFVRALWLVQRYGTAEAVNPCNDQSVKAWGRCRRRLHGEAGNPDPLRRQGHDGPLDVLQTRRSR